MRAYVHNSFVYVYTSDPSLTPHNVSQVMEVVRQRMWSDVGIRLSVPEYILNKIDVEYSNHDEKMSAVANYVANIIPGITWETIATVLYKRGEKRAVDRAKSYLHTVLG